MIFRKRKQECQMDAAFTSYTALLDRTNSLQRQINNLSLRMDQRMNEQYRLITGRQAPVLRDVTDYEPLYRTAGERAARFERLYRETLIKNASLRKMFEELASENPRLREGYAI